jgi:antitoxin component YwqK of YwqJK toxin-antitoxin module
MTRTLDAALAVTILAFVPGCGKKATPEVSYKDLGWENDKYTWEGKLFTGAATEKHKNGQTRIRWEIQEGVPHGVVKEWHDNGQIQVETHYDSGKRHGLNRYWTREGHLMKEQVYEHGTSVSVKEYPLPKP